MTNRYVVSDTVDRTDFETFAHGEEGLAAAIAAADARQREDKYGQYVVLEVRVVYHGKR